MPGTAFLGPIFTGATTKSLSQTSLSFGTNRIVTNIHEASKKSKIKIQKLAKKVDNLGLKQSTKNIINFHK